MDGTWKSEDHWGGMADEEIVIPEFSDSVPADVVAEAQALIAQIKAGTLHPFSGPIKNQAGELIVAEGEILPHGDLAGMNWYVEGVPGEIPR
jgi:simple sugar transport system substrate-binding protein